MTATKRFWKFRLSVVLLSTARKNQLQFEATEERATLHTFSISHLSLEVELGIREIFFQQHPAMTQQHVSRILIRYLCRPTTQIYSKCTSIAVLF